MIARHKNSTLLYVNSRRLSQTCHEKVGPLSSVIRAPASQSKRTSQQQENMRAVRTSLLSYLHTTCTTVFNTIS